MIELTIGIFTCDAYKDLWEANVNLLLKNFPNLDGIHIIFVTDKEPSLIPKNMQNYRIIWNENQSDFLSKLSTFLNCCPTDYFLFLLDDYFFTKRISAKTMEFLFSFVKEFKINYLKLNIKSRLRLAKHFFYKEKEFAFLKTNKAYAIDLYPSIWNKKFVEKTIEIWPFNERTIWDYEGKIYKLANIINLSSCYCYCEKDFYFEDVVRKGKILRKADRVLRKKYNCDLTRGRKVMSRTEYALDKIVPFLSRLMPEKLKKKIKSKQEKKGRHFYS